MEGVVRLRSTNFVDAGTRHEGQPLRGGRQRWAGIQGDTDRSGDAVFQSEKNRSACAGARQKGQSLRRIVARWQGVQGHARWKILHVFRAETKIYLGFVVRQGREPFRGDRRQGRSE